MKGEISLEVQVQLEPGGEDEPIDIPATIDFENNTLYVYVNADEISKAIAGLLLAPPKVSDFALALHGLAVSQTYRLAWRSARRRAKHYRALLDGGAQR